VGGDRLVLDSWGSSGERDGHLGNAELSLIPLLGEVIAVKDSAVTSIDLNWGAASDVCRHVVLLSAEGHSWAVSQDWVLGKLLALEELREGSTAAVLCVDLLDLHRVVTEEEVEGVELVATIVSHILPQDLEGEDTTVIVKEALEATVGSATFQLDLDIVLELSLVGRCLFHVDHAASMLERIVRVVLGLSNVATLVGVVAASELVAVNDTEDTSVDVEVHTEAEIRPVIVTGAIGLGELSALEENALRDSRVLHTRLNDVEGVILHVEVDDALPDAVVLITVLYDGLKEVRLEVQDLAIVFQPLGSDSWNGVVLLGGTARHSGEALGRTLTHGGKNRWVDGLVHGDGFLDDGVVLDAEQLGLVISCDCGVCVHISGQHGQAGGHIRSLHPFVF